MWWWQKQLTEMAVKTRQRRRRYEWNRVLGQLKEEIGEIAYRSWLAPINVQRIDGGEAIIAAPARVIS